ncbi:ArsA family ATPase [Vallicoccus soli]|uniref:ArsA family ATPase n=1 Tax=Vallicoccus soli TaxID=2339232 RepID=A0A3A3Z125_9ACTN|nr:ArsA family ATPase [Vallicoccus soli]RJK96883.1 ArsA family ATPase [Vallicoccus soli]
MRALLLTGSGGAGTSTLARAAAARARAEGADARLLAAPPDAAPGAAAWADVLAVGAALTGVPVPAGLGPEELPALPLTEDVRLLLALAAALDGAGDLVVADLGPLPAARRLLALPGALAGWVDALAPVDARLARALAARGPGALEALDRLRRALDAPDLPARSSLRVVVRPEAAAVDEALAALPALALLGHPAQRLVASRVAPGGGDDLWRHAVAAQHAEQVRRLRDAAPVPVDVAPWAPRPPADAAALAALGAQALPGVLDAPAPPLVVEPAGEGYVLRLALPLARRDDLLLGRVEDDLVLALGALRRRLPLPAALRRCTVEGAALRGGELTVRFRPDPALWRTA